MKTVICVFKHVEETSEMQEFATREFAFNTDSELSVGDMLMLSNHDIPIIVTKVFDKSHKYFDVLTNNLSDKLSSTSQRQIHTLIIKSSDTMVVYASLVPMIRL